jgi:hypothetical protein
LRSSKTLFAAKPDYQSETGFIIDYDLTGTLTNFTFSSDTTYMVTNTVTLAGTTTFEGGTVVKFSTNASAQISTLDALECKSGPYRPVVFTAKDDDTVGFQISGSTGHPTNYYGQGLVLDGGGETFTLQNLRCSHLNYAVQYYVWWPVQNRGVRRNKSGKGGWVYRRQRERA